MKQQGECRVCAIPLPYPYEYCSQHPEPPMEYVPQPTHAHRAYPGQRWTDEECPICNHEVGPWPAIKEDDDA